MRINPLTPSSMEIVSTYSKDTSETPTPRATAASLFISRTDDAAYVRLLLQDSCAEVRNRKEVLLAVMRKKSPMLADAVRQLIHDPDSTVVDKALLQGDQRCRIYAIQALRDLKNRAARAPLEELLKRETDELARVNIVRALENLDKRGSGKSLLKQ